MNFYQLMRVMKLTMVILTCFFLQLSASTFAQRITINTKNTRISTILQQIRDQSGYDFFYDAKIFENSQLVSLHIANADINDVLQKCFENLPYTFEIDNRIVVIRKDNLHTKESRSLQKMVTLFGQVTNNEGKPIVGVSLRLEEIAVVVQTNVKGDFEFKVPPGTYTLSLSHISFVSKTIRGVGISAEKNNPMYITMQEKQSNLDEVVVTALGIKRAEKSLGYATSLLKNDDVTDARTNNWANALNGKVAGLSVKGAGAGPMASARITLRGENSLNLNNNQALIVVDGVPISNKMVSTGFSSHLSADNPVDYGSHVSDINPEDIESMNVLKGPAATALYGSRAAAGAIIITTKSGSKTAGLGITYNLNSSIDQINRWPEYQFEYGEGRTQSYYSYGDSPDGANTSTQAGGGRSWGPKYEGQMYYQYDPNSADGLASERTLWKPYKNAYSGYFRLGNTISNNVSIIGGNDNGNLRLSMTHLQNKWIIPNTGFERFNASLAASQKIADRLTISTNINYNSKNSDNLPAAGYNNQTLMYYLIIGTTTNVNPDWMKKYWEDGMEGVQQRRPFYQGPDNPYLAMYEMLNKLNKNGVFGNISANYKINDKLDLTLRSAMDMSYEKRSQQRPFSMTKYPRGMYRTQDVFQYEGNHDFLFSYKDQQDDWRYGLSVGGNMMRQSYDFDGMYADQLNQPGIYQISNSLDPAVADPRRSKKAINSLYGMGQLSYKDRVFLDLTGRNDWSSTLPAHNNSFFYPSVSTSFVVSEMVDLGKINYAKLRLSWAQVGNDTDPYQTSRYYNSIYGNGFTNPTVLFNANLKPEITTSYEVGTELRFWNSRLTTDLTLYSNKSRNQIIAIPIDPTSSYQSKMVNAGLINSLGIEWSATVKPLVGKLKWESTIVWSANRSYVRELAPGVESQVMFARGSDVSIEARVGGRMGDIYGKGFERSPDGQIVYSSEGIPSLLDPVAKKWGNVFPDWKAGLTNTFAYGNMKFSVLIDGQKGGKIYSLTNHKNNEFGNTKITLPGREGGILGQGVVRLEDGSYVTNSKRVEARPYYEQYYARANAETNIFDASFLKIREMRFEYSFPKTMFQSIHLSGARIAIFGRDLFNFTKFPAFDPEGGNLDDGTLVPGIELGQYPSTRTIGLNLSCNF
ncbi:MULTISPECIES: SusC/RagA family TonB-linked outer membrane protein [Sphingobacterium]|uniref:SusC/RagA family TonB-linked outer membrane protein n=1 Tax=Sphingobacterium TaxID=28453 RepID=UPI00160454A7|nr:MULTISPECIES: SusC/RagA family TonB-linked outer membrane protein [unclassified Sphingobacterium]MBB1645484.1 SusC/RagA family protein [Sphingobacterium sp. UME9]